VDAEIANYTDSSRDERTVRGHLFDAGGAKVTMFEGKGTIDESESTTISASTTVSAPENWLVEDQFGIEAGTSASSV